MFEVNISIKDNKVLGELVVDSYFFEPSKYDYAFYLYKNGERVGSVWYTKNMDVSFELKNIDLSGDFYIRVFIRDIEHGDKRTFNSKIISIDS